MYLLTSGMSVLGKLLVEIWSPSAWKSLKFLLSFFQKNMSTLIL